MSVEPQATNPPPKGALAKSAASPTPAPRFHPPTTTPGEVSPYYRRTRSLVRAAIHLIGRLDIQGRENFPAEGPVILASNHRAHVDPPYLSTVTDRHIFYMGKEELFTTNKLLADVIIKLGAFPIRRGEADRAALRYAVNLLKEGRVLCIFPEGTRSADKTLLEPEKGFSLIAKQSGAAIVPIAIENTERVLPKGTVFFHRSPVYITIGEPITAQQILDAHEGDVGKDALDIIGHEVMRRIAGLMRAPA